MGEEKLFCKGGGCTAKLGAGILSRILERIPRGAEDPDLLIGYDSHDDAAVYRLTDDLAFVQTLDFFPPLVEDPYTFGQIAATNALSDIYAMGGEVKTALNIVCFPETMDLNILGEIMRGGAEKVIEAGIILCASRVGEASEEAVNAAIQSMTTLNKTAAALCRDYHVHAVTDVTGFSFLGHLHEMLHGAHSAEIFASQVPVFSEALRHADEFLLTAAGQRNVGEHVRFDGVPFAMEEVLFDPQTSGGLLIALPEAEAPALLAALKTAGLSAGIVGRVRAPGETEILVRQ